MTDDSTKLLLLSYDKEPVVVFETYFNLGNGAWLVEIRDKGGNLLRTNRLKDQPFAVIDKDEANKPKESA